MYDTAFFMRYVPHSVSHACLCLSLADVSSDDVHRILEAAAMLVIGGGCGFSSIVGLSFAFLLLRPCLELGENIFSFLFLSSLHLS